MDEGGGHIRLDTHIVHGGTYGSAADRVRVPRCPTDLDGMRYGDLRLEASHVDRRYDGYLP